MEITAGMVKQLRDLTGVGMMDCKKALAETNGDMEAAIDWLRTRGLAKAAKKADRVAVRHIRRDGMDALKKAEKDGMSEDESRAQADLVQKATDAAVAEIDQIVAAKEAEIMQV